MIPLMVVANAIIHTHQSAFDTVKIPQRRGEFLGYCISNHQGA